MHLVTTSIIFLWGDKAAFQNPIEGEKIAEKMKSSQFITVKNAGQLPWLDQT